MIKGQFEELKHTGELPSPSGVGMKILVETQRDDCSLDDIVHIIQADPALTGRIIKLASSAQFGGSAAASNVKDAAMRLGMRTVSNVALGFTLVAGNRSGRCESFDYKYYWSWSLANAVAASVVSRELATGVPAEAFTCGLLCRIGQLALASVHPTEYAEVLQQATKSPDQALITLERKHFRIDQNEVTRAMLADWALPEAFGVAAEAFGADDDDAEIDDAQALELLRILNVSSVIAETCVAAEERQHHLWGSLKLLCDELDMEFDRFEAMCDEIAQSWAEWGEMLKVPTQTVESISDLRRKAEAEARREEADSAASAVAGDGGLRILAVDDDPVSLKLLQRHLEKAGHSVVTASNGRQALAAALETNPQIVVTDWMMPEMDGLQFCKALRRFGSGRKMYVLLLTGRGEEDRIVEAFEAGVDDYIVKPFKPKLLLARIRAGRRVVELQDLVEKDKKLQREQVAKLAVLNRKLRAAALTDPLTDLPNRRYAMKRLDMEWANAKRSGNPMSVIMLDIDEFKRINDSYGHDVGDVVLKETAAAMQRTLRRSDTCARMGGEEFLVICPNTDPEGAANLAERIRAEVEQNLVKSGNFEGNVTASLGFATRTHRVGGVEKLLKLADEAVYEAKAKGRNCVVEASDPPERKKSA